MDPCQLRVSWGWPPPLTHRPRTLTQHALRAVSSMDWGPFGGRGGRNAYKCDCVPAPAFATGLSQRMPRVAERVGMTTPLATLRQDASEPVGYFGSSDLSHSTTGVMGRGSQTQANGTYGLARWRACGHGPPAAYAYPASCGRKPGRRRPRQGALIFMWPPACVARCSVSRRHGHTHT